MNKGRSGLEALANSAAPQEGVRNTSERDEPQIKQRVRGVFNGTNKKLDLLTGVPGYQLRWFNDMDGRLELAQSGGWEFVQANEVSSPVGGAVVNIQASDMGTRKRAIVGSDGRGNPMYAYLMKIRQEWYDEDQRDKAQALSDAERAMIESDGLMSGKVGERYLPDGRKSALTIRRGDFTRG